MLDIVKEKGIKKSAEYVDVVTTGTFGPMCSSVAIFNIGHPQPKMKIQKSWLNDIECYSGLAAVDMIIGAAQISDKDPVNSLGDGICLLAWDTAFNWGKENKRGRAL